jgi:hypothetical protein
VLELHSNSATTATGEQAKSAMDVYQLHETIEATFGVLRWLEIGQYFCTAKFPADGYQYTGSRSKIHFGIPQTLDWPVQFGGNIELDYMRRQAEVNPLNYGRSSVRVTETSGSSQIWRWRSHSRVRRRMMGFNSIHQARWFTTLTGGCRRRWNITGIWDRSSRYRRWRINSISSCRR